MSLPRTFGWQLMAVVYIFGHFLWKTALALTKQDSTNALPLSLPWWVVVLVAVFWILLEYGYAMVENPSKG